MMVLSRQKNESIIINDDITIVIVDIRGDKVRLGVEGPKDMTVHRSEVYEAIYRHAEPISAEANDARIRQRIEELRQEIRSLEARLSTSTQTV